VTACLECQVGRHTLCMGRCGCRLAGHGDAAYLQHTLGCAGPDVTVTNGVTRQLLHCRNCGAEVHVDKERP